MYAAIITLMGIAILVAGVTLLSVPVGLIVAGVLAVGFGLFGLEIE